MPPDSDDLLAALRAIYEVARNPTPTSHRTIADAARIALTQAGRGREIERLQRLIYLYVDPDLIRPEDAPAIAAAIAAVRERGDD